METIQQVMSDDHRDCDDLFAKAENAIHEADFVQAASTWQAFREKVLGHFELEEQILFPGFEQATGMQAGPTMVMRSEHEHMREMLQAVSEAIEAQDVDAALGLCESLMIFVQQHNMKEEQILYPMLDQHVATPEIMGTVQQQLHCSA